MLTLEERIARLEKQTHVVSVHADSNSAALADIPDEVRVLQCSGCCSTQEMHTKQKASFRHRMRQACFRVGQPSAQAMHAHRWWRAPSPSAARSAARTRSAVAVM